MIWFKLKKSNFFIFFKKIVIFINPVLN